jgi:beta-lactamase regulating signal transducer with metallopeptidase domain
MTSFFEAILNGWWQGILLTFLVWLVLRDLRRISAATRVAIWHVTLLVVLLLPALQRIPFGSLRRSTTASARQTMPLNRRTPAVATPLAQSEPVSQTRPAIEISEHGWAPVLLSIAIGLAIFQVLRLAIGYGAVRRLKAAGTPAGIPMPVPHSRPVELLVSDRVGMPVAVGYLRPAILLPRALTERLAPEEMQYVLLHESAHLRRNDDWMALFERIIRALFCFQPAVYWIGRQIEQERELACDDWVIAQSGQQKQYAGALAHVAELGSFGKTPALASGAGGPKQIFVRLEALLDRTRNSVPSISEPWVLAAALVLLLAVYQGTSFNHFLGFSGYSNRWVVSDGTHRFELKMRGNVEFSPNDDDVVAMSPDARLVVEEDNGWRTSRAEFEADYRGNVVRRYFSGGIARPFDTEARRFLAATLPRWAREQGYNIPERTSRLVREKGMDEAMGEVRTISRADVKRKYLEELFTHAFLSQAELTPDQLRRSLKIAGEIGSDGEKRRFFENVHDRYLNRGVDSQLMSFVDSVHSNEDRRQILVNAMDHGAFQSSESLDPKLFRVIGNMSADGPKTEVLLRTVDVSKQGLPEAFFDAASTIHRDSDRQRLLSAVLSQHGTEPGTVERVLRNTASVSSDVEKTKILVASTSGFHATDPAGRAAALREVSRVLESINSQGERRRALEAFVSADGENPDTLREVLVQTSAMHSDGDKRQVLLHAVTAYVEEETIRRAFFSAVQSIHSSGDQRRVLTAVLARPSLERETLQEVSLAASRMPSHKDQAAVLREIADRR